MNIIEWFDPHNKEHLKAYKHLEDTGAWPKGFVPRDIIFTTSWMASLNRKMADCWVNHKLEESD